MTSRSTFLTDAALRASLTFTLGLAVCVAAFLFLVGLGPDRLPFPPESRYSDAVTSHWPNALVLKRAVLEDHAFPLWRPSIMSGQPFAANPLNKVWYPFQWLVLVLPPAAHLNVLTWLHITLAGFGMWVWSRGTGLLALPAALAGVGYAFAPRVIAALGAGHVDLVYAAAWLPWLMWAVHRLLISGARMRWSAWSALFAALAVLADVRFGAYALALACAYMIERIVTASRTCSSDAALRVGGRVLVFALIVIALTALVWVPLLLYRADLSRVGITLEEAAVESLSAGQWVGLLFGNHGGAWESMVYVGVSTLALAGVTVIQRPRRFLFWWGVLLFVALYAMGEHSALWIALNRLFPFLRWWRVPPRAWLIAAWILPYLAGWGAQLLVTEPSKTRLARLSVVALLGGGLACGVFSMAMLSSALTRGAVVGTFALPAVALVMLLALTGKASARVLFVLFALIVVADVLWIDRTLVEGRHKREWLEPYRALAEHLQEQGATRVYSPSYSLPQQAAAYWRIAQFDGVDPFQFQSYGAAFSHATGVAVDGYSITLPPFGMDEAPDGDDLTFGEVLARANRDAALSADALAQWHVSHVVAAFAIDAPGLQFDTQIGDVYVYRNTRLPDATVRWDGPNRVTVRLSPDADGPFYAFADGRWRDTPHVDSPGWPGSLDGAQRAWTFAYDPSEVWLSALVMGLFGGAAVLVWWRLRRV